jgi:hypothetical protein
VWWAVAVETLVLVGLWPFTPARVRVFWALVRQDSLVVRDRRAGGSRPVDRFIRCQADHPLLKII